MVGNGDTGVGDATGCELEGDMIWCVDGGADVCVAIFESPDWPEAILLRGRVGDSDLCASAARESVLNGGGSGGLNCRVCDRIPRYNRNAIYAVSVCSQP